MTIGLHRMNSPLGALGSLLVEMSSEVVDRCILDIDISRKYKPQWLLNEGREYHTPGWIVASAFAMPRFDPQMAVAAIVQKTESIECLGVHVTLEPTADCLTWSSLLIGECRRARSIGSNNW